MMKVSASFFFFILSTAAWSQGLFLNDYRAPGKPLLLNDDGTISGSPYLTNEWGRGFVYINDKVKSDEVFIRYDVLNQMAEMKDANGNVFTLDPLKIRGFKFTTIIDEHVRNLHLENGFIVEGFSKTEYFEKVWEGKNKYLRHYRKQLVNDPSTYGATKSKTLTTEITYVVIKANGDVVTFKENKKTLLKAFPSSEKAISQYIKTQNIKVTDHEHMTILFQYLDSLSD